MTRFTFQYESYYKVKQAILVGNIACFALPYKSFQLLTTTLSTPRRAGICG